MTHFSDGVRAGRNFANNGTASEPGVFMSPINVYNVVPIALVTDGICLQQTLAAAGRSIDDIVRAAGYKTRILPRVPILDSINAARTIFPSCWFDREHAADGINCLRHYRYEVDPVTGQFSRNPLHDHYSHGADAFRYIALMIQDTPKRKAKAQANTRWSGA